MSDEANGNGSTPAAAPAPKRLAARLTLEEKLWFDRRKSDLEQYSAFGAGIGAVVAAGVTSFGPFNRRVQLASIIGCAVIGGGSGYLYADTKSLARIEDLSAQSRLRKEYQQLYVLVCGGASTRACNMQKCKAHAVRYVDVRFFDRLLEKKASTKSKSTEDK